MKSVLTSIVALGALTLAACAGGQSKPVQPNFAIIGSWQNDAVAEQPDGQGSLIVRADSVTFRNTCTAGKEPVTVEVTSPAIVSASHVNVLQSQRAERPAGDATCVATIEKGLLAYKVKDGQLVLLDKKGQQTSFHANGHKQGFGAKMLETIDKLGRSAEANPQ